MGNSKLMDIDILKFNLLNATCNINFSCSMGVPEKMIGTMFTPVPVDITSYEPERVGSKLQSHFQDI